MCQVCFCSLYLLLRTTQDCSLHSVGEKQDNNPLLHSLPTINNKGQHSRTKPSPKNADKVYCLLSTVYCLLSTDYCLLSTFYRLLSSVYCLLSTVYFLLPSVYCLLFFFLFSFVFCLCCLSCGIYYFSTLLQHCTVQKIVLGKDYLTISSIF